MRNIFITYVAHPSNSVPLPLIIATDQPEELPIVTPSEAVDFENNNPLAGVSIKRV